MIFQRQGRWEAVCSCPQKVHPSGGWCWFCSVSFCIFLAKFYLTRRMVAPSTYLGDGKSLLNLKFGTANEKCLYSKLCSTEKKHQSLSFKPFSTLGFSKIHSTTFLFFKGCFNTPLEHTPLPTSYKEIAFIVGKTGNIHPYQNPCALDVGMFPRLKKCGLSSVGR